MTPVLEILLVEDNEGDVEITRRALSGCEPACNLSVANDGLEALDLLTKRRPNPGARPPQLIFLDLNMPRMDGKALLEELKKDQRLKTIPVIMFTSSHSPKDIRECFERHASAYVVKPFDGKAFGTVLRQVLTFWTELSRLPPAL
ncbi:MAG: response regulator [Alphaproteobacteria bacterium]|nr:response regulator [Alphaproteobacteria bacterium]